MYRVLIKHLLRLLVGLYTKTQFSLLRVVTASLVLPHAHQAKLKSYPQIEKTLCLS